MKLPENAVHPRTRAEWRAWLNAHHGRGAGVWFVSWKKSSGKALLPYGDAVEEALCFGWVDSVPRKLDAERTMLWFAPRKAGSGWSRPNKERVARLLSAGLMAPAGLAKVKRAKADGSWTALDAAEAMVVPPDLAEAFVAHPGSAANFDAFPPSTKKGILSWISAAKRAETRGNRVAETARLAARKIRANQWRP